MGPLTDAHIRDRLSRDDHDPQRLRIIPFVPEQVKQMGRSQSVNMACVGFGLSSMGYDIRLGSSFRFLKTPEEFYRAGRPVPDLDPLDPDVSRKCFDPPVVLRTAFTLPPGRCVLATSVEWLRIPEDVLTLVLCKSTWARCFADLNTTPLEPGWQGEVTVEIVNHATLPLVVRPGEGIGQLVFLAGSRCAELPYSRRKDAAYQDQRGPTPPQPVAVRSATTAGDPAAVE